MTSLPLADQVGVLLLIDFLVGGLAYFLVNKKHGGHPINPYSDLLQKAKKGLFVWPRCHHRLKAEMCDDGKTRGVLLSCPFCEFREY